MSDPIATHVPQARPDPSKIALTVRGAGGADRPAGELTLPPSPPRTVALSLATALWLGLAVVCAWKVYDWGQMPPRVVAEVHSVEPTRVRVQFNTDLPCRAEMILTEHRPGGATTRHRVSPGPVTRHGIQLVDLRPDTTYRFQLELHGRKSTVTSSSEFTTRAEVQIFNVHVDEHETKAVITWETNVRTDTTVRYGPTESYEDLRMNPEQKSEIIHSITLEGLKQDATCHYQIVATDASWRGEPKCSEDLQFRTSRPGSPPSAKNGLENLVKSYVDKLTRMTPDERERLKQSLGRFTGGRAKPSPAELKALIDARTSPTDED